MKLAISFDDLRAANRERESEFDRVRQTSLSEELADLAHYLINAHEIVTRMRRGSYTMHDRFTVAMELASIVINLDNLAAGKLGIILGASVKDKWNADSRQMGSDLRLVGRLTGAAPGHYRKTSASGYDVRGVIPDEIADQEVVQEVDQAAGPDRAAFGYVRDAASPTDDHCMECGVVDADGTLHVGVVSLDRVYQINLATAAALQRARAAGTTSRPVSDYEIWMNRS